MNDKLEPTGGTPVDTTAELRAQLDHLREDLVTEQHKNAELQRQLAERGPWWVGLDWQSIAIALLLTVFLVQTIAGVA